MAVLDENLGEDSFEKGFLRELFKKNESLISEYMGNNSFTALEIYNQFRGLTSSTLPFHITKKDDEWFKVGDMSEHYLAVKLGYLEVPGNLDPETPCQQCPLESTGKYESEWKAFSEERIGAGNSSS